MTFAPKGKMVLVKNSRGRGGVWSQMQFGGFTKWRQNKMKSVNLCSNRSIAVKINDYDYRKYIADIRGRGDEAGNSDTCGRGGGVEMGKKMRTS